MFIPFVIVSVVLLAERASALAFSDHLALRSSLQVHARQLTDGPDQIPSVCDSACAAAVQAFDDCTITECLCNNEIVQDTAGCFSCLVSVGGLPSADDLAQAQASLDNLEEECAAADDPVSSFIVTAVSSIATISTFANGPTLTTANSESTGTAVFSIPIATGTSGPSIFFSSGGGASAPLSTPVDTASASETQSIGFSSPLTTNTQGSAVSIPSVGSSQTATNSAAASGALATLGGLRRLSIVMAGVVGGAILALSL